MPVSKPSAITPDATSGSMRPPPRLHQAGMGTSGFKSTESAARAAASVLDSQIGARCLLQAPTEVKHKAAFKRQAQVGFPIRKHTISNYMHYPES